VTVRYTPRAFAELQDIFPDIDEHSQSGGRNVKSRVHAVIELIAAHPGSRRRIGERGLRISVFPYPYFFFYRVVAGEVVIQGVRHASRDPASQPG
jgi:plasmid stabilization system protein ParE